MLCGTVVLQSKVAGINLLARGYYVWSPTGPLEAFNAGGRYSIDLDCIPHKSLNTYFSSIWIQ